MTHDPLTFGNLFGICPDYKNAPSDYEQGQRDMLAKCIAAVEAWALEYPYEHPSPNRIITALRALEERP